MCSIPEDVVLTTLNIPLIGIVKQLKAINNPVIERTLLATLQLFLPEGQNDGLFIQKTMNEIVFGYDDGLLAIVNGLIAAAKNLGWDLDLHVPPRYEILKNGSAALKEEWSAVHTGKGAPERVAAFQAWAGNNGSLNTWNGCGPENNGNATNARANMINGTEGVQFPPGVKPGQRLDVFTDDLSRSAELVPDEGPGGVVEYKGVKLRRYRISKDAMSNVDANPDNCAFSNFGPVENPNNPP